MAPSSLNGILNGSTAVFACETRSYPVRQVQWLLNDKVLDISRSSRHSLVCGSWLQIAAVTNRDDGKYHCRFTSDGLPNSQTVTSPAVPLTVSTVSVSITISSNVVLPVGNQLRLVCRATGTKIVSYVWYRNGINIGSSSVYSNNAVTLKDTGVYCCKISNKGPMKCLSVYIYAAPILSTGEPSLYEVEEGRDMTLQCSTLSAKPYVTWQWIYKGKPVVNAVQRTFGQSGILTIRNVTSQDGGQYDCIGYQDYSKRKVGRNFTLTVIANCPYNELMNSDASKDAQFWAVENKTAQIEKDTDGNAVFVIKTGPGYTSGGFWQIFMNRPKLPVQIVARARMKCSNGTSSDGCPYLQLRSGSFRRASSTVITSMNWRWATVFLNIPLFFLKSTVSVHLLTSSTGTVQKTAYFDDICIKWLTGSSLSSTQSVISTCIPITAAATSQSVNQSTSRTTQSGSGTTQSMFMIQSSPSMQTSFNMGSSSAITNKEISTSAMHTGTTGILSSSTTAKEGQGQSDKESSSSYLCEYVGKCH